MVGGIVTIEIIVVEVVVVVEVTVSFRVVVVIIIIVMMMWHNSTAEKVINSYFQNIILFTKNQKLRLCG